jgi:hypothetical protein
MEKKILDIKLVDTVGEYGIVKSKEELLFDSGKSFGARETWYDVCLDNGDGDIVSSFTTLKDARQWAKEN